jgi:hypothetical protein
VQRADVMTLAFAMVAAAVGSGWLFERWATGPAPVRGRNVAPPRKEDTPCP